MRIHRSCKRSDSLPTVGQENGGGSAQFVVDEGGALYTRAPDDFLLMRNLFTVMSR